MLCPVSIAAFVLSLVSSRGGEGAQGSVFTSFTQSFARARNALSHAHRSSEVSGQAAISQLAISEATDLRMVASIEVGNWGLCERCFDIFLQNFAGAGTLLGSIRKSL